MISRVLCTIAALSASFPALAEQQPAPGRSDARMRSVVYSPNNVVAVDADYGISTMIVLGASEHIETITVGDSLAWKVEPNKRGNIIFLKPVAPKASTNMNVVTDKRLYTFVLRSHDAAVKNQVYSIRFSYPGEDYDAKLRAQAEAMVSDPNRNNFDITHGNTDYGYKGSETLKPIAVFDDGTKTFFQFRGEVPGIFIVDSKRNESLINGRREGNFIVIDKISRQWTLRSGDVSTCIFNLRPSTPVPTAMEPFAPTNLAAKSGGK